MNIIVVIPGRLAASRFPNKPLATILGIPMIGHCYLRAKMCKLLTGVYVATCDGEIARYIESIGGTAIMTSAKHQTASDRTAEAVRKIERMTGQTVDIVVMVQGDEPMVTPSMIQIAIKPFLRKDPPQVVNLMARIETEQESNDVNEVKVVSDRSGKALYFSREPIPSRRKGNYRAPAYKQVCVIPFRRNFLFQYLKLRHTPLELAESIDMNRVLEHGLSVQMVETRQQTYAVDTPEDLEFVRKKMKSDPLTRHYLPSRH